MIVEFFGLPGTGKTTYKTMLLAQYPQRTASLTEPKRILTATYLPFLLTKEWLAFFGSLLRLWVKKKPKAKYDLRAVYGFCRWYLRYMEHRRKDDGTLYLCDHGLIQCISSIVWDDPDGVALAAPVLRQISRCFGGSVLFLSLEETDDRRLYERIRTRAFDVRLKHFSEEDACRVLDRQRELFASAQQALQADRVLPVSGDAPLEENYRNICTFLHL